MNALSDSEGEKKRGASGHGTGGLIVRVSHAWGHFSSTAVRPRTPIFTASVG
jgi:hypothetical protein